MVLVVQGHGWRTTVNSFNLLSADGSTGDIPAGTNSSNSMKSTWSSSDWASFSTSKIVIYIFMHTINPVGGWVGIRRSYDVGLLVGVANEGDVLQPIRRGRHVDRGQILLRGIRFLDQDHQILLTMLHANFEFVFCSKYIYNIVKSHMS